jgi:hypothetical protein
MPLWEDKQAQQPFNDSENSLENIEKIKIYLKFNYILFKPTFHTHNHGICFY